MLHHATREKPNALEESRQFCRNAFLDDPSLSIDAMARLVNENCTYGLIKSDIARIRQEVREKISTAGTAPRQTTPVIRRFARQPFNPPHFKQEPEPPPEPAVVKSKEPEAPMSGPAGFSYSTTTERSRWLSAWAEQNPSARIQDAREALIKNFGIAIGTAHIAETLKLAREMRISDERKKDLASVPNTAVVDTPQEGVADKRERKYPPTQQEIEEVVQKCRTLGITAIQINGQSYRIEVTGTL